MTASGDGDIYWSPLPQTACVTGTLNTENIYPKSSSSLDLQYLEIEDQESTNIFSQHNFAIQFMIAISKILTLKDH